VSMLNTVGIETEQFADSTGPLEIDAQPLF
jgi:hypothetical protein